MKKIFFTILVAMATCSIYSCKTKDVTPTGTNNLAIYFENNVGGAAIGLGTSCYKNASGEDFKITALNYYISNVILKKSDGTNLMFKDQYFLVQQSDSNTGFTLKGLPAGDYTQLTFTVGVDSSKSVSDVSARTGVLDPSALGKDMYWSWNSGYIFLKLEGSSAASLAPDHSYKFHIGGFGGRTAVTPNNIKTITLPFDTYTATVRSNIAPEIHLSVDILKLFGSNIKIAEQNERMSPALGIPVANNYASMFSVEHIHNDPN